MTGRTTKVNKDLYEKLLAFYLEQNKQYAAAWTHYDHQRPQTVEPPAKLRQFESQFQGCSLGPFPWPDNPNVQYRVVATMDEPRQRGDTGEVLIATYKISKDRCGFATWSVCGACWVIVSPTHEVLDSPWRAP